MDTNIVTLQAEQEQKFQEQLRIDVYETCLEDPDLSDTEAFVINAAEATHEGGNTSDIVPFKLETRSGNDHIRLYGYSELDETGWLNLFTGRFDPDASNISNDDLNTLIRQALNALKHTGTIEVESDSPVLRDFCRYYEEVSAAGQVKGVRLNVCYNGRIQNQTVGMKHPTLQVSVEVFDAPRLFRLSGSTPSTSDIVVDFRDAPFQPVDCLEAKTTSEDYKTYLFLLDGQAIHRLMKRYSQRLFDLNLRTYLRATTVNKEVIKTIRDQPGNFLAFNNGICATAEGIEIENGAIQKIVGLQIVNGAQTSSAIHKAAMDKVDVSGVHVSIKLTIVKPENLLEFVPLIAKYANTHNKIDVSDLSSNNAFNSEMSMRSNAVWCPGEKKRWFYERAKGMYEAKLDEIGNNKAKVKAAKSAMPKITKLELAKYLGSWDLEPHVVSNGGQYVYRHVVNRYMARLTDGSLVVDDTFYKHSVAKAIVFRKAQQLLKKFALKDYGHVIYPYAVALLALSGKVDLDSVWDNQELDGENTDLLEEYMHLVQGELVSRSQSGINVGQWAKKEPSWKHIREIAASHGKLPVDSDATHVADADPQAMLGLTDAELCNALTAKDYTTIYNWASDDEDANDNTLSLLNDANATVDKGGAIQTAIVNIIAPTVRSALRQGVLD